MTDVANFLEGGQAQLFERVIETNYTASYFQLETERLHVEVWDAEGFYMNKWMAYNSIPLIDIIDGPMQHTIELFPYNDKLQPDKLHSTVNLKINFSEVWDFNLEFFDWKTTSLIDADEPEKSITSQLQIEMLSKQVVANPMVTSADWQENTPLPYWKSFKPFGIVFRGSYHELKAEELLLTLK